MIVIWMITIVVISAVSVRRPGIVSVSGPHYRVVAVINVDIIIPVSAINVSVIISVVDLIVIVIADISFIAA